MGKDYYNILGVSKGASQEEIKKVFRKKAHQYHPDKAGGDEAKFKEINEAYQVLGDSKKRAQYDQFGSSFEHAQAGGGFQGFDGFRDFSGFSNGFNVNMDDIGDIFGGIGDIFGFGGGRGRNKARNGSDIQVMLNIDFNEAVFGVDKELNLRKKVVCDRCRGNGAEPGSKIKTCSTCGGSGVTTKTQRTILGNMQVQSACQDCAGEGKKYDKLCSNCRGSGISEELINLKVKIPAGIDNGETIRLSGHGQVGSKGARSGDLYLKIKIKADRRFRREGYNIFSRSEISFIQAALGDKIEVETVEGLIKLKIPAGTQSGTIFKLRGKGVARLRGGGRGDHLVEVIVKTPVNLNKKQKKILEEFDN